MRFSHSLLMVFGLAFFFIQCQPDKITITPMEPTTVPTDTTTTDTTATDTTSTDTTGDSTPPIPAGITVHITGDIATSETWTSGNTYILDDLITVQNGATLTIDSCVVIKAAFGETGLVIAQGATIDAQGTASCPVIFTSVNDSLSPGMIVSPNLGAADHGLWGGLFILGEAPVSTFNTPAILDQLPAQSANTYGGTSAGSNSGTLRYVSIRHGGYELVEDWTPCGLILAGVGSGTTIDHVELFSNSDDGLVVIGGTVTVNDLVTSGFNDDAIDCDKGFGGILDNMIGIGGNSGDAALELDGGEGSTNPSYTIRNSSFKGAQDGEHYIDFQKKVNCLVENTYFFGFDAGSEVILERDIDASNWVASLIDVSGVEINVTHLSTGNTTISSIFQDKGADATDAFLTRLPNASIVTSPSVGADKAQFLGWTVADQTGQLSGF